MTKNRIYTFLTIGGDRLPHIYSQALSFDDLLVQMRAESGVESSRTDRQGSQSQRDDSATLRECAAMLESFGDPGRPGAYVVTSKTQDGNWGHRLGLLVSDVPESASDETSD